MWDSCHPHNSESTKSVADDRDTDLVIIPKFIQWIIANLSMSACSSFQVAAHHWYSQWIYPSQAIQDRLKEQWMKWRMTNNTKAVLGN